MRHDRIAAGRVAEGVADFLVETACWHRDRCAWLGWMHDSDEDSDELRFRYGTLAPDLYGGVAGIALFLAEAFGRLGDVRLLNTAVAGLHHAIDKAHRISFETQFGWYQGRVGIGGGAVWAGLRLGREDLVHRGKRLLSELEILNGNGPDTRVILADLIAGASGSIPPLLQLADSLGLPNLRELAISLGETVLSVAERGEHYWQWPVSRSVVKARRPLTGLSHGAAGIGWALFELGSSTQQPRFTNAGHQAFRYENHWFRSEADNWPDFRSNDDPFAATCEAWCHGAPGIGLSRLRAVALGHSEYQEDAAAALRTTLRALENPERILDADLSLCHGLFGLGEILRYAGMGSRLVELGEAVATRYGTNWSAWPIGVQRGSNPSLMIGLAGVGWFFLGLADPDLPTVLLPGVPTMSKPSRPNPGSQVGRYPPQDEVNESNKAGIPHPQLSPPRTEVRDAFSPIQGAS